MSEVKGVGPDAGIVTNEAGGKQSATPYAFHLIPHDSMFALAEVFAIGAKRYARDNWRKISAEEHFNHMEQHARAYLAGDRSDDHLGHMLCRAHMMYSTAKDEERACLQEEPEEDKIARLLADEFPEHTKDNCGRRDQDCPMDEPENCDTCRQWKLRVVRLEHRP